jgi:hypothetical protein
MRETPPYPRIACTVGPSLGTQLLPLWPQLVLPPFAVLLEQIPADTPPWPVPAYGRIRTETFGLLACICLTPFLISKVNCACTPDNVLVRHSQGAPRQGTQGTCHLFRLSHVHHAKK